MDFLEKLTNFAQVFYVIRALNKKSRQSLRVSPESPFDWKFFKVGSMIVYSFVRNIPNLQVCRLTLVSLTALTIKGVYVINNSWYGQILAPVCKFDRYLKICTINKIKLFRNIAIHFMHMQIQNQKQTCIYGFQISFSYSWFVYFSLFTVAEIETCV